MIVRIQYIILLTFMVCVLAACGTKEQSVIQRPSDPWAFRSVLDKKPRMLTLALDSGCYAAYDLDRCTLYKVWKGGVLMEGTAYNNKKNIQPTSWGTTWYSDSIQQFKWTAESHDKELIQEIRYKGYIIQEGRIRLEYALHLSSRQGRQDTIYIEERPEFIRGSGKPGYERVFTLFGVPEGVTVSLQSKDTTLVLAAGKSTRLVKYFEPLARQSPPDLRAGFDHLGRYWMEKSDCFTCHDMDRQNVGPSFRQIALKYRGEQEVMEPLIEKVRLGGSGTWGPAMMSAHPDLSSREIKTMMTYILSLDTGPNDSPENKVKTASAVSSPAGKESSPVKPGFGASLEGVHPSYTLSTIHPPNFRPRVGGLAFLPSGDLLVSTWDSVGGVYRLSGVETGDSSKVTVKRIASGLAEPLGLEVVNGEIFVLQKQELTQLIDLDGDGVTDEYRAVCNSWEVSADFHEFAFGLVWKDGYFYVTLSLAMRLMAHEQQKPDRGRTLRISRDGRYEWLNYGLRTPNGIGLGVDDEIFITDNQGQWLPSNKLIHVRKGDFHGMRWGLPDSVTQPPRMTPPTLWLPQHEIGNSPSEPLLLPNGPYKGQMLHGDVTHGGIKRDFLEKVAGEYQGAVFRFTQGLEAGVNRLCLGPDGALYIGGVGMVGGWSWNGKQYGLQRMEYNGKPTFEMLAIRAKPEGFEIEFTQPLDTLRKIQPSDFFLQQWWYLPTESYGGPKMDLETLKVTRMEVSEDKRRVYLEIPGLKEEHVVYFRLAEDLLDREGQGLWSSEAWYTLNNIPGYNE